MNFALSVFYAKFLTYVHSTKRRWKDPIHDVPEKHLRPRGKRGREMERKYIEERKKHARKYFIDKPMSAKEKWEIKRSLANAPLEDPAQTNWRNQ